MLQMAESELLHACRIVYCEDTGVDLSFLRSLQPQCLKSAYRRRALVIHPDLHANRGPSEYERHNRLFQDLTAAYQRLCKYLELRVSKPRPTPFRAAPRRAAPVRPTPRSNGTSGLSRRHIPSWRLRIGEFLFHSGRITWSALIAALVRQRQDRMPIGRIAQRWGWLTEEKIQELLRDRRRGERIGDIFVRRRVMTTFRLGMLLSHQRRLSKPLGTYFVEAGLIDATELANCLLAQHNHNQRFGLRTRAAASA